MSSFQQFKRSQHSQKSNKSSSRLSFKSFDNEPLNLANLSFSINEVVFELGNGQQIAINQELRVANRTGTKLYFQIKSSNPQYYEIRPSQDILQINAIVKISFRFNLKNIASNPYDRNVPTLQELSFLVKNNVFEFSWGQITQQNIKYNQIPKTNNHQILRVRVEGPKKPLRSQRQDRVNSNSKNYSNGGNFQEGSNYSGVKAFHLSDRSNASPQDAVNYSSLLSVPIIAGVAFLSFIVGYVSA